MSKDYELIGAIETAKQIRQWAEPAIASNRDDVRSVILGAMLEAAQLLRAVDPPSALVSATGSENSAGN